MTWDYPELVDAWSFSLPGLQQTGEESAVSSPRCCAKNPQPLSIFEVSMRTEASRLHGGAAAQKTFDAFPLEKSADFSGAG
jgi:hypothetical protein